MYPMNSLGTPDQAPLNSKRSSKEFQMSSPAIPKEFKSNFSQAKGVRRLQ